MIMGITFVLKKVTFQSVSAVLWTLVLLLFLPGSTVSQQSNQIVNQFYFVIKVGSGLDGLDCFTWIEPFAGSGRNYKHFNLTTSSNSIEMNDNEKEEAANLVSFAHCSIEKWDALHREFVTEIFEDI